MRRAGIALIAACGGAPAPAAISHHQSDAWSADLAVFDSGTYRVYSLAGDRVTEIGKVVFAANADGSMLAMTRRGFGWADRDHLIVGFGDDVKLVTASGTAPIAVPAEASMVSPPKTGDDAEPGGILGLTVTDGEVWWSKCAWGFPADGFQCTSYVHARIWPSDQHRTGKEPIEPQVGYAWPKTPPKGFRTKASEDDKLVSCQPPTGPATELRSDDEGDLVSDSDLHWISQSPPRLLVEFGQVGLNPFPTHWSLHDGCTPQPLERGTYVHAGPNGLWVAAGDKVTIRRGTKVLGELPSDEVRFRP